MVEKHFKKQGLCYSDLVKLFSLLNDTNKIQRANLVLCLCDNNTLFHKKSRLGKKVQKERESIKNGGNYT